MVRVDQRTRSNTWKRDAKGYLIPGDGYARTQIYVTVPEEYELLSKQFRFWASRV